MPTETKPNMIENLEAERHVVIGKMLEIAKNRKAKKNDRIAAARLFLQETEKLRGPNNGGAEQARQILEGLK